MPYSPPWVEPGWPQLPDQGMSLVSAFNAGQQISAKRQQLENQLAAMALRQQNQEMMMGLREAEFNRKLDQGNQRIALAEGALNLRGAMDQWRMDKDKETMEDITGLAQGLGSIDLDPADPNRPAAIWKVIESNARAAKAAPGLIKDAFSSYNNAARTSQSRFEHDYNDFIKDVKNSVGRGQLTDLNFLYNMDQWKDKWVDKEGKDLPHQPDANFPAPPGAHKTGEKWAEFPPSQVGGTTSYVTLPSWKITDLKRRLDELDNRKRNLPTQVSNEYATPEVGRKDFPQPSPGDIAYLKAHPEKSAAFDSRFGPGTASQVTSQ